MFYESPQRLLETLENIKASRGSDAKIAVGRELTKLYEEVKTGTVQEIIDYYSSAVLKGEIVCLLYAKQDREQDESEIVEKIKILKSLNYSDKDISAILSALFSLNKNNVYKLALTL